MAKLFFRPGCTDMILGSRKRDAYVAKRLSSIREFDVLLNYQKKDVIDLPGDWRRKGGRPLRLTRPVLTHDFDTQGGHDELYGRLATMPPKSVGIVKVFSSIEEPGRVSSVLLVNDKRRGWVPWVDGSVFLPNFNISKLNPVSII